MFHFQGTKVLKVHRTLLVDVSVQGAFAGFLKAKRKLQQRKAPNVNPMANQYRRRVLPNVNPMANQRQIVDPRLERTQQLYISWDWENVQEENPRAVAMTVVSHLLHFLPNVSINSFKAYSNRQISATQCLDCNDSAVSVMFVQGQAANPHDSGMITDLLLLARESPPASYFLVITGERDFCQPLRAMRELGHTVLLAYPEGRTHPDLFHECDFRISWERLSSMELNLGVNPFLDLPWPQQPETPVRYTAVLWDCLSCIPRHRNYRKAAVCINQFLLSHPQTAGSIPVMNRAYSSNRYIEQHLRHRMEYVFVSPSRGNKHLSLEITMLVDGMKFINDYKAPANVVILTSNVEMARTVQVLKLRGYTVLLVVPDNAPALLRAAGHPNVYSWAELLNQ